MQIEQKIDEKPGPKKWQKKIYEIIYEADTPAGKAFDVLLLLLIILSVIVVMLESIYDYNLRFHDYFFLAEWIITIVFTIEYILRIISVRKKWGYIKSFYGVIDFLAILPAYISLIFPGAHLLVTVRALRLLRIFRIFKLGRYLVESQVLVKALKASRPKITIFLGTVFTIVIVIGTMMYLIEHDVNPDYSSIPSSMYWAIVTLTTVGFGDIVPVTITGKFLASLLMITGYAIIAVPTGIVSVELSRAQAFLEEQQSHQKINKNKNINFCSNCGKGDHEANANFCKFCGHSL